jgi:hypothetical protein
LTLIDFMRLTTVPSRALRRPAAHLSLTFFEPYGEGWIVEIGHFDHEVAGELLLDIGVGSVEHLGVAITHPDGGCGGARFQPFSGPNAAPALPSASLKAA